MKHWIVFCSEHEGGSAAMEVSEKNRKHQILIIGDNEVAPYHPLEAVKDELSDIFSPFGSLQFSTDEHAFGLLDTSVYHLCISYIDRWKKEMPKEDLNRLKTYLQNGGRILVLHNGLSYQENSEFAAVTGARFTGHPPRQPLLFTAAAETIVNNAYAAFTMNEEPYQFAFSEDADSEYFLYYTMNGKKYPAGWIRRPEGKGIVMYVMPGHDKQSFRDGTYADMLRGYVSWLFHES